jgi:hypothetical protein
VVIRLAKVQLMFFHIVQCCNSAVCWIVRWSGHQLVSEKAGTACWQQPVLLRADMLTVQPRANYHSAAAAANIGMTMKSLPCVEWDALHATKRAVRYTAHTKSHDHAHRIAAARQSTGMPCKKA